ncbi:MAG TPA: hypothetical protein PLF01_03775 [Alphaproteobacteria bacterium]|nr:hypothetical protein [Alphaproteobacteria bacterium]
MSKLIRFISFIIAMSAFISVYSKPEVREALMMSMSGDISEYTDEVDVEYDDDRDDDEVYAYDDYDTDYDY